MAAPRAIFFDLDGTLLDVSERFHRALNATRVAEGLAALCWEEFLGRYSGATLSQDVPPPRLGPFWKSFLEEFSHRPEPHPGAPFPGVPEMLETLAERGLQVAIVTNRAASSQVVGEELRALGLSRHFKEILAQADFNFLQGDCASDTGLYSKEAMICHACERLGVTPGGVVMVGDLITDIVSARKAGCALSVGVLTGGMTREGLEAAGADHVIESAARLPELL